MAARGPTPLAVGLIAFVVAAVAVGVVALLLTGDQGGEVVVEPGFTATPVTTAAPAETTAAEPGDAGDAAGPDERVAADFVATYAVDGASQTEAVVADLDGADPDEVIVASVVGGRVRVDVAAWQVTAYEVVFSGDGGSADELADISVRDVNATPQTREIVTTQTVGTAGQSLSVWGWDGSAFVPHRAVDGCWDGSNTYGIVGAALQNERITAT